MQKLRAELGFGLAYPGPILGYYPKPASVLMFFFYHLPIRTGYFDGTETYFTDGMAFKWEAGVVRVL